MNNDDEPDVHQSMPVGIMNQTVKDHKHTSMVADAHPLAESTTSEVGESSLIHFSLAAIQAVADQFIDQIDEVILVDTIGDKEYYWAKSSVFAHLDVLVNETYDSENLSIEQLQTVVDGHTIQFLSDLHEYEGDFKGRERTLSNALNDPKSYEGAVTREAVPEGVQYGFVDARGLLVQRGTHYE